VTLKEAQSAVVDAQISLPRAGRGFPDQVTKLVNALGPTAAYIDQLSKMVCKALD
jgi:hypothetical protein